MAKHGTDPVLHELVRAVNESAQARVPVTVSVHGTAGTAAAGDDDKGPFARLLST
jgi:hypothetical protein